MTFDVKGYRKRVLLPYKGARNRELQGALRELKFKTGVKVPSSLDLAELYDVTTTMSEAEVATRVAEVADTWNKTANNSVYRPLTSTLTELHRLIRDRNPELKTRAFWVAIFAASNDRENEILDQFAEHLAAEHQPLGMVTDDLLRRAATAANIPTCVSDADLSKAMEAHGVSVVRLFIPPDVLVPDAVRKLRGTTFRSVVDVIFLENPPETFSLIDRFSSPGGNKLTLAQVKASRESTGRHSRSVENDAADAALLALGAAAGDDAKLADIVLAAFLDLAREVRLSCLLLEALKRLIETGLDRSDGARMLVQLDAGGSSPETMAQVMVEVREGKITEARCLYDSLAAGLAEGSVSDEADTARASLEEAERRLTELRAIAEAAVAAGDMKKARSSLEEAVRICSDDESLRETLQSLPPASPLDLVLALIDDGRAVRVMWSAGFGSTDACRYSVVRKTGSAPRHPRDGVVIADSLTDTLFDDPGPPIAVRVFYGVAASRGGPSSVVTTSHVLLLPTVTNVAVTTDATSVTVSWVAPPEASNIQVIQTGADGTTKEVHVGPHSSATASHLTTGLMYTYLVTAQYLDADGAVLCSKPQRIIGKPRPPATPITDLMVACVGATTSDLAVAATWEPPAGYDVEVWHFPSQARWSFGTRVPMSELRDSAGTRLVGRALDSGSRHGVAASTGVGLRHYLAVTRDGEVALVGATQELGVCLPVTNPAAQRFGDVTVLTWDWPGRECSVEASWSGPGVSGRATIDRSRYQSGGGMRLTTGSKGCTITLTTFIETGHGKWSSAAVCLTVQGAAITVSYDVKWVRKVFGRGGPATVVFSGEGSVHGDQVIVVGKPGHFMPITTDGARSLAQVSLKLDDSNPTQSVDVDTRGLGSDFWIRAFSVDPARTRLVDPPSAHLRGR